MRWSIPFAGFFLSLMGGIAYAWGVFIVPLEERFGWSRTEAALPVSIYLLFYTVGMLGGGFLQDKLGPRKIALAGAGLFFSAYMLAQMIGTYPYLWWLLLTYGVMGGTASGLAYSVIVPAARKWFPDKASLAITIGVTGFGLASVFFAPWLSSLIATRGIEGTFLILAIVTGSVSLIAAMVLKNPEPGWSPPGWVQSPQAANSMFTPKMETALGETVKQPLFYLLWVAFGAIIFGGLMAMTHVVPYGQTIIGLERADAAYAMVFFGLANGFGRTLAGFIAQQVGPLRVMLVTYIVTGATFLLFNTVATTNMTLYVCALILGFGFAVTLGLFPVLTSISFGVKNLGANYGAVITAYGVAAIFGPVAGGYLYDISGTYIVPFAIAGGLTLFGWSICLFALKMKHKLP